MVRAKSEAWSLGLLSLDPQVDGGTPSSDMQPKSEANWSQPKKRTGKFYSEVIVDADPRRGSNTFEVEYPKTSSIVHLNSVLFLPKGQ